MREARLFEKIRIRETNPSYRDSDDPGREIDSIINHIRRIFNTYRGNVPISEEYGVPDYTDFISKYPDSLREFERALKHTIVQFEPRLKMVRVDFIPQEDDSMIVKFQISAKLAGPDFTTTPVLFESHLDVGGKISIHK